MRTMTRSRVITLLTDFGHEGGYVSALKGVILSINPEVHIVDISHEVGPQNVFEGAFTLFVNYRFFPKDTIHVAVVDPGVGSARKLLCARTSSGVFIAPDNGLLTPILDREKDFEIREINNQKLFLPAVSHTFHGRDKMAPAAAHLSRGLAFSKVGPKVSRWKRISFDMPHLNKHHVEGKVISIDRFGNLITNITSEHLFQLGPRESLRVRIKGRQISRVARFFSEVPRGELLALVGSSDFLEISKNLGSAAAALKATLGDPVEILRS